MEYVVVDIETTGLSRHYHKITEVAAVKVKDKEIVDEFQTLVNPKVPIPKFIKRLTGIDDDMVKFQPTIDKVLPHFFDFIGKHSFVAHNATFDYNFINHNSEKHLEKSLKNPKICTRVMANRLLPELPSKKLSVLCNHFEIINNQSHRAMSDVLATNELFQKLLEIKHNNTHSNTKSNY